MPQYVILVGGIGGNELYAQSVPLLGAVRVWLDPVTLAAGGWRWLELGPDGQTPPSALFPFLSPRGLLPAYYDALTDWVYQQGWVPVHYQQDWRFRRGVSGLPLATLIRQLGTETPVHIVAHSRGGLVVRAALSFLTPAERNVLVSRCAGLGVPHYGSWEAVLLLAGTNETAYLIRRLVQGIELAAGLLDVSGGVTRVIETWPAVYELMPKPGAPGVDPATIDAVYNAATWASVRPNVSPAWLSAARTDWGALPDVPADVAWLDVVGFGQPTAVSLDNPAAPQVPASYTRTLQGDGTVSSLWARAPGKQAVNLEVSHGEQPYDASVLSILSNWFQNGQVG